MERDEIVRLAEHDEAYWWHVARRLIVQHALSRCSLRPTDRVLDVGCGTGATSAELAKRAHTVACDFSGDALRYARERGLDVARADATVLPFPDQSFQLVVALDVVEHLDDDAAALREFMRVLKPGGHLLLTVPAYQRMWSAHDEALGHRRRYSRNGMVAAVRGAGLAVEFASYMMASILPAAALVRWVGGLQPRDGPARSSYVRVPAAVNALIGRIVGLEGTLLDHTRLPFGLSVIVVASRRSAR